jgi:hypothetical protein
MNDEKLTLYVDHCEGSGFYLDLRESTEKGLTKFRGKFQQAEEVNKNKRMYPYGVLDENVKRLKDVLGARGLMGELDHPQDSIIHMANASHVVTKLWWEGNVLMGEGEILSTPAGKVLKALINDGVRVGISSRGVGSGRTDENGILVIGESYRLITFDAVADPSTFEAYQEKVVGNKRESYQPNWPQPSKTVDISRNNTVKNEGASIHTVSKEALIACLGGMIKQKTNNIKARLS